MTRLARGLSIIILAGLWFVLSLAPALAYYNPGRPSGLVNDFGQMLSPTFRQQLESELLAHRAQTSNEIAVVTITSLQSDTIENFAVKLFEEWGIGQADVDNGVLLLIARDEREVRIEPGYGLEGALTDIQSNAIIQNEIVPAFRQSDYDVGVRRGVAAIEQAIAGEYEAKAVREER